jgi:type IV pilus assembly protein PilQ
MKGIRSLGLNNLEVAASVAGFLLAALAVCPTQGLAQASDVSDQDNEAVRLSRTGTFEIHVQGADLRGVLQLLSTQGKRNIVATKEVTGTVTADLYGVTFDEALEAVMRSSGYVYQEKGNFVYVYTPEQLRAVLDAERKIEVRVFHLHYLTAEDAKTLITPTLSENGTVALSPASETGIETSDTETGGDSLAGGDVIVVRDYEDNVKRAAQMIEEIDVRPEQVLIEATILRATLNEDDDMGIDFNVLSGVDFETFASTTTALQSVVPEDDTPITDNTLGASVLQNGFASSVPAGGLSIGVITNNVSFFIRALESITDTTVLANPKLLVLNKQRAEVMIGRRDGYLTTNVTETVATQTVEFLETGTRLVVRPFVGKNGFIRMEIHPEDSSGSVVERGAAALPSESTTETTSNIMVRDGRTIVIGGLFRESTTNGRSQIPVLGNLPIAGVLFRSTSDSTVREEVIILVTPHIIQPDADGAVSERLKDDVDRFRIGQRKGLQWFDSSRLAQTHMRWAKQSLAKGDLGDALWNVDMALSMNPRMDEAIHLKERLTQQAYWADESRVSSVKYVIQKMVMQELGLPYERIVMPDKPIDPEEISPEVRESFGIGPVYQDPLPTPPTLNITDVMIENGEAAAADDTPAAVEATRDAPAE